MFRPADTSTSVARPSPPEAGGRKRKLPRRIALLALVCAQVLFAGVALWAVTSSYWQVHHVRVEGTDDAVVVRAIEAMPLTGCNIFRCDLVAGVRRVEALPAVARAGIRATYPDTLVVSVTLRQPALLWSMPSGQYVIASDGTVLGTPDSDPAYADAALAVVRDDSGAAFGSQAPAAGSELSPTLVEMAGQLRKGVQDVLGNDWALAYNADTGFFAASTDGRRVAFGMPRDAAQAADDSGSVSSLLADPTPQQVAQGVQTQLAELRALLHQLGAEARQAVVIDLRWGGHPYYRLAG